MKPHGFFFLPVLYVPLFYGFGGFARGSFGLVGLVSWIGAVFGKWQTGSHGCWIFVMVLKWSKSGLVG